MTMSFETACTCSTCPSPMARGFNLTAQSPAHTGGDLDIYTKAEDSDTIIRDAIVLVVRTRRGDWYYNPASGLDPETANLSTSDADIRATIEADLHGDLSAVSGFSLDSVSAERVGNNRNWRIKIVGRTTRGPLVLPDLLVEL